MNPKDTMPLFEKKPQIFQFQGTREDLYQMFKDYFSEELMGDNELLAKLVEDSDYIHTDDAFDYVSENHEPGYQH